MRTESHQRAIDQIAVLFPHLSISERMEWWDRLQPCSLTELTVHIPNWQATLKAMLEET